MARHAITIHADSREPQDRARLAHWCANVPTGYRVEFKEAKRSHEQNDRMWELLGRVSKRMTINGAKFQPEQWKAIFMQAMGRQVQVLPALDGSTWFPTGFRSSDLSVREMADLQTFIEAHCAEQGVDIWGQE
ncbi:recombination protein NinB [Paracoccus sp. DMF-8]|uniref:recombination protein NinB n=1 Tax=Paracoccus sp. DMF-8 TaxID=3019445 RepID=UPI0023E394A4|nr:recombination protein NinB [Paracoccus sp. DMF-8]MDF3607512.1 recombination protein NinB [Paracoccus sp. DMF-8]